MAKYINQDDTIEVLDRVCKACDKENCYRHKGREYCPVMAVIDGIKDLTIADVQPVVDTENTATVSDEFICKNCGIYLKDYVKVVLDEDNEGYVDEQHYDYEPKFCPECGAKVKED